MATLCVALTLLVLAACGEDPTPARRLPDGSRLVQKKEFQALYGADGRLERVLRDDDGDGVAEAIVLYGGDGVAVGVELDMDGDHVIDRRETRGPKGRIALEIDGDGPEDGSDSRER